MHPLGTFEKVQPQWQLLYLFFWECVRLIHRLLKLNRKQLTN